MAEIKAYIVKPESLCCLKCKEELELEILKELSEEGVKDIVDSKENPDPDSFICEFCLQEISIKEV